MIYSHPKANECSFAHAFGKIFVFLLLGLLTGCQTLPQQSKSERAVTHVDQVQHWTARGKMMVADNKEKVSGYFYWQQNREDFEFSLDTLIGTNIVALRYKGGLATIDVDGKQYQDTNPERLVYRLTGHRLPIQKLPGWFLAKIAKNKSAQAQPKYDSNARLASFRYQGPQTAWLISYSSWTTQDKITLPKSINLESEHNRVKISISDWLIQG